MSAFGGPVGEGDWVAQAASHDGQDGTDPGLAAWGRVGLGTLHDMIRTKNRFDRQVAVCRGLGLGFRSFGDFLTQSKA